MAGDIQREQRSSSRAANHTRRIRAACRGWNLGSVILLAPWWSNALQRILFVEDDDGVRASTEALLKHAGFHMLDGEGRRGTLRLLAENRVLRGSLMVEELTNLVLRPGGIRGAAG